MEVDSSAVDERKEGADGAQLLAQQPVDSAEFESLQPTSHGQLQI